MKESAMKKKVLVTGVSGYLGQHVTAELLNQGYEVVGTVRSISKSEISKEAIAAVAPVDHLSFATADLLADTGWQEAMFGCEYVLHLASPFILAEPKNENDLIEPAVDGTKRVLNAAKIAGVKRVVLTSSTVSMTSGKASGKYGPDAWSEVASDIGAYAKSKTLAERAAWEILAGSKTELSAINPGFILGPSLGSPADGQSIRMISDLVAGKIPMIPDIAMGMVDVRDVAKLHVAALTANGAAGNRFIAASADPISMSDIAQILREAGYKKVPSRKAPNFAIKVMSLFDREAKGMVPQLGKKVAYDNRTTYDVLKWQPTEFKKTLLEMAASVSR